MITYKEIIVAVRQLHAEEQLTLMGELAHMLTAERRSRQANRSSLERVRGMLKPEGPVPSEYELHDAYTDYLTEKYN